MLIPCALQELVGLMHMRLQGRDADATKMVANMQASDWCQVLRLDLTQLESMCFKALLSKCRQLFLSIPAGNRTQPLQDFIDTRISWVSPGYNPAVLVKTPEQRQMVLDFAKCILSSESGGERNPGQNQTSPQSMKLAKLVANGALSGQGVLEFLLSAAVEKADKERRGCKRVNATATMQGNQDTLAQVAWSLGPGCQPRSCPGDLRPQPQSRQDRSQERDRPNSVLCRAGGARQKFQAGDWAPQRRESANLHDCCG